MTRFYIKGAHPADRFIGAPCGCIFILRRYDDLPPGSTAQAESFYCCAPCATDLKQRVEPGVRRCDYQQASTYYYAPVQNGEGVRWQ